MRAPTAAVTLIVAFSLLQSCTADTTRPDPTGPGAAASVELPFGEVIMHVGDTMTIRPTVLDAAGRPLDPSGVWSSADPLTASVDQGGLVTARKEGSTQVAFTVAGLRGALQVQVTPAVAATLEITPANPLAHKGDTLHFSVQAWSNTGQTVPVAVVRWTSSSPGVVTIDSISGEASALAVGGSDVTARSGSVSAITQVAVENRPPVVAIVSPGNGTTYSAGGVITFQGSASDPDDGPLVGEALVWSSEVQGAIGSGSTVERSDLAVGAHVITLTATDRNGGSAEVSVSVTVAEVAPDNQAPSATINRPAAGSSFAPGETIVFSGSGTDPEDGALQGAALTWSSSRDGVIGIGASVSRSDLSVGTHTVTLTARDSQGSTAAAQVGVAVHRQNQPPSVTIVQPADSAFVVMGVPVVFEASGTDPEDGVLPSSAFTWTCLTHGESWTGGTSTAILSQPWHGHQIKLVGHDSDGATGEATIVIWSAVPPVPAIQLPVYGATFSLGDSIRFSGQGNPTGDVDVPDSLMTWSSDRDGALGTGTTFVRNDLSAGTHVITLHARNETAGEGSDQVTINVRSPASVTPYRIAAVSGSGQSAGAAEMLPEPLVAQVLAEDGAPLPDVALTVLAETSENGATWVPEPTFFLFSSFSTDDPRTTYTTLADGTASFYLRMRGASPATRRYHRVRVDFSDSEVRSACEALNAETGAERCAPGPLFDAMMTEPPDLTVEAVAGHDVDRTDTMTVTGRIVNQGGDAGSFKVSVGLFEGSPPSRLFAGCGVVTVSGLAAGATYDIEVKCGPFLYSGHSDAAYVVIDADYFGNQVIESNELNNRVSSPTPYVVR